MSRFVKQNKYKDPSQYKKGSVWYIKAVLEKWNISFDAKYRQKLVEIRKSHALGRNINKRHLGDDPKRKFSTVYKAINEDTAYLNAVKTFLYQIKTGRFDENKEREYVVNYIQGLKRLGIDNDIIEKLQMQPEIILSKRLPEITEFYIPVSKAERKKYHDDYKFSVNDKDKIEKEIKDEIAKHWS